MLFVFIVVVNIIYTTTISKGRESEGPRSFAKVPDNQYLGLLLIFHQSTHVLRPVLQNR
jgi:hypothetical protein